MPRSANASRIAADAGGDGGMGTGSGITRWTSERSRRPLRTSRSCTSSAVSLGAGGHLNGTEQTPTTTRPPAKSARTSRVAKAPDSV